MAVGRTAEASRRGWLARGTAPPPRSAGRPLPACAWGRGGMGCLSRVPATSRKGRREEPQRKGGGSGGRGSGGGGGKGSKRAGKVDERRRMVVEAQRNGSGHGRRHKESRRKAVALQGKVAAAQGKCNTRETQWQHNKGERAGVRPAAGRNQLVGLVRARLQRWTSSSIRQGLHHLLSVPETQAAGAMPNQRDAKGLPATHKSSRHWAVHTAVE